MSTYLPITTGDWDSLNLVLGEIYRLLLTKINTSDMTAYQNIQDQWKATLVDQSNDITTTMNQLNSAVTNLTIMLNEHVDYTAYSGHLGGLTGEKS